jgi:hypothetical protein
MGLRLERGTVRVRLLLFASCLVLMSTLVMRASQAPVSQSGVPGFPMQPPVDCGGEPCEAVPAAFGRSSIVSCLA